MSAQCSSKPIASSPSRQCPRCFFPGRDGTAFSDYEKMFCADIKGGNDVFAMRGIDREAGCIVVVRPDQYVAHVLPLDGYKQLASLFGGFMLPQSDQDARRMAGRNRSA